jgi:hypothetical protein
MKRPALGASALLTLLFTGCAHAPPPPPPAPVVQAAAPPPVDPGPTSMESEIGGMNEEAVSRAFAGLADGVVTCADQGRARLAYLGGQVTVKLRVDRQGGVRWAYLSASTLGDLDTEKCVLDLVRHKTWPRPVGGEGIAESSFEIDTRTPARAWSERQVEQATRAVQRATAPCRREVPGGFTATAYVRADGRVASAGVAVPSEKAAGGADCVVEALRKLRFGPQAGAAAKVSFLVR